MSHVRSYTSIVLDDIKYDKVYKAGNNVIKSTMKYHGQNLFINGPKMLLGSDIIMSKDVFYIDLVFDKKSKNNMNFFKFVKDIDNLIISEVYANSKIWYPNEENDVSLTQIECEYIPTVKLSAIHNDYDAIKLKIPTNKIEFFDQDHIEVPYQLIKEKYQVVPLLHLSSVYKDHSRLWIEWELPQLKIDLPENIIKGCQLIDIEDDSEDEEAICEEEDED